jgi:hypothetical protein
MIIILPSLEELFFFPANSLADLVEASGADSYLIRE